MKIIHCNSYEEMSAAAAKVVCDAIATKPDLVLGLATGSTPEGLYAELCREYKEGRVDFSRVTTVNLDEYCGIPADHPQSYMTFMKEKLFDQVNLDPAKTHLPDGNTADHAEEAARYEKMVEELGFADLQILGVGRNGHIGFNEPAEALFTKTHLTALTKDTVRANARFFASVDDVPKHAITMGVGTIMAARHIVLLASGEGKRPAISTLIGGMIDTICPVTLLQLHPNVTLICDDSAWPRRRVIPEA